MSTEANDRPQAATPFEHALAGYDTEFRHHLAEKIITTITAASIVSDADVMAIRTTETSDALADVLVTVLALVPDMDVPSRLRETADALAKRIRREVAQARAEGVGDIFGAGRGGCA